MILTPMTAESLGSYLEEAIKTYADEHVRSGNWAADQAQAQAEREFADLLPDGIHSKDQYLFTLVDDTTGADVGMIWYGVRGQMETREAWIWDFKVDPAYRRRGYGRQALAALEHHVKEQGLTKIGLHVFGHNDAARSLYEAMGYAVTNLVMSKTLSI